MPFDLLLALARTFTGPQLAAIARHQGDAVSIAGARLRNVVRYTGARPAGVLTFDALYALHGELVPGSLILLVSPEGFEILA